MREVLIKNVWSQFEGQNYIKLLHAIHQRNGIVEMKRIEKTN